MTRSRDLSNDQANLGGAVPPYTAGKNAVINGGFDIAQRGTSFTSTNILYTLDRWQATRYGTANGTVSQQLTSDTTNLPFIQYCIRVANNNGATASGTYIFNTFETVNSIPLAGKTVTMSFYARKGATYSGSTITANLISGTGTDQNLYNGFTGQVTQLTTSPTLTTTWTRYSVTGTIPSTATQLGISILINGSGTAGATDYAEITGVQVEAGSSATPFSRAGGSIGEELLLCMRYYTLLTNTNGSNMNLTYLSNFGNSYGQGVQLPVPMRTSPTVTLKDIAGNLNKITVYNSSGTSTNNYSYSATGDNYNIRVFVSGNYVYADLGAGSALSAEL